MLYLSQNFFNCSKRVILEDETLQQFLRYAYFGRKRWGTDEKRVFANQFRMFFRFLRRGFPFQQLCEQSGDMEGIVIMILEFRNLLKSFNVKEIGVGTHPP